MTDKKGEALKQALEALEYYDKPRAEYNAKTARAQDLKAITAIREALAEQPAQQQEPVAFEAREIGEGDWFRVPLTEPKRIVWIIESAHMDYRWVTSPPASKPLTDEQAEDAARYAFLVKLFGTTKLPCMLERALGKGYIPDGKESIDAAIDAAIEAAHGITGEKK